MVAVAEGVPSGIVVSEALSAQNRNGGNKFELLEKGMREPAFSLFQPFFNVG